MTTGIVSVLDSGSASYERVGWTERFAYRTAPGEGDAQVVVRRARRLQKPVIMLEYVGENHGLRKPSNQRDYTVRMKEYFDHYLMGAPAPDWMTKGYRVCRWKST
ncbi:MAG: S9 family peptidase [Acidobacteria bacterium]|nr:S9 family peptidase [Acidobacteriota bacterium]